MNEHNPAAIVTTAKAEPTPDSSGITSLFAGWTPAEVDLVRRTIAPDATEHELALLLRLCRTYGLDPFRRELVMEKRRRRRRDGGEDLVPIFITTRDGYLKVAQRDPSYRGLQSGVVHEGDEFEYDVQNFTIRHRFGANRGKILGAWAIASHTTRPPFMAYVEFPEYNDPASDTWRKHPAAMIQKVAEVFVLRRQFGITAIVAREEISRDLADDSVQVASFKVAPEPEVPTTVPAPGAAPELTIVPSATDFWRAVRAAAARVGSSAIEFVRTRAGGETDLRKLAPDVAMRIYSEAMQFIEADPTGTTVAHPRGGAGEAVSRKPRTGRVQRDYTQFWATVRKAAEAEGDPSPQAWLARLANGVTDPRDLDDATFIGLLAVSTRVANGEAATKEPPTAELATPAVAQAGDGVLSGGVETEPIRRDQIREIQRFWRDRKVHPNTQCEQVRQVTGSHMILARMTEVQADQLLEQLQQQAAEAAQPTQSSNEDRAAEDR